MDKKLKTLFVAGAATTLLFSGTLSTIVPVAQAVTKSGDSVDDVEDAYKNGTDTGASRYPASIKKVDTVKEDTIRGIDLTPYQAEMEAGVHYKNFDGKVLNQKEMMDFLKEQGVNYVTLKVAVDPKNKEGKTYGGGAPTLEHAIQTAKVAKEAGLHVNMTFLFSDFYTSKEDQKLPKAWANKTGDDLTKAASDYFSTSLDKVKEAGIDLDMVTIGSYMNNNFLNQGADAANQSLAKITKVAREKAKGAKIALGYASPYKDWYWQIADGLEKAGVDYDVMGADIYSAWDKIENVKGAMESVHAKNKKFAVLSVSYPFTQYDSDGKSNDSVADDIIKNQIGKVSPQGQATYMRDLYEAITADGNNEGGAGAFYNNAVWIATAAGNTKNWEKNKENNEKYGTGWATTAAADYVSGAGEYAGACTVDNQALFDDLGQPLQSLKMFGELLNGTTSGSDNSGEKEDPWKTGADTGLKDQKVNISKVKNMAQNTIRGVDISSYTSLKEAGVDFKNFDGTSEDLVKILHDNGVNYLRLRIWNDPYATEDKTITYEGQTYHVKKGQSYGGGVTDVKHELEIAKSAAKYNIPVQIDFHYSDFWADPAQQILPKAWQGLTHNQIKERLYQFTKETLEQFEKTGVTIGMVQVGNEITNGMAGICSNRDMGEKWSSVWKNTDKSKQINDYLNAGAKAVREAAPKALIALQLETPEPAKYRTIMDTWKRDKVDYDVLGSSYYPFWSTSWKVKPNTPQELKKVQQLAADDGKYFAVMETSWVNSLKDADGTPNSIGEDKDTSAFKVGPQGQVDALNSVYNTVLSQNNGLGVFYWEPAWIPVKAGWMNWKENQEAAEKYGTGWASEGALGYFPNRKMFYEGKPAWGGASWDNQSLFDPSGNALQSLKFYQDSISNQKKQTITNIQFVDAKTGDVFKESDFVRQNEGDTKKVALKDIKGWKLKSGAKQIEVKANGDLTDTVKLEYLKVNDYKKYVTVTSDYDAWNNLDFDKKLNKGSLKNKTFYAKYAYHHDNGNTYLSLYDKDNHWVGYMNQDGVSVGKGEQGAAIKTDKTITVTDNKKYKVFADFDWKKKDLNAQNSIFKVKYEYHHLNGSTYYSLYDLDDHWVGYINAHGTSNKASVSKEKGEKGKVTVTAKTPTLYKNSRLQYPKKGKQGTVYDLRSSRMVNGKKYYKVYQDKKYQGYISVNEVKVLKSQSCNKTVKIHAKSTYTRWGDLFFHTKKGTTKQGQTYKVKRYYVLGNGRRYYSLYAKDRSGKEVWQGYVNADATK